MKRISLILSLLILNSCAELQQVVEQLPQTGIYNTNTDIADALKQALNMGIDKQVSKLTQKDGFYNNELVKILLPEELQKVDRTLRNVGLGKLADEGLLILNRAAEDAVKEATPIFVNAVKEITFTDAKNILMGDQRAATTYLENKTSSSLYESFNPVIRNSLDKTGASRVWQEIIEKYNKIPLTGKVNPDLPDYVTTEALNGVFTMIAVEEQDIRNNVTARTTNLLKRVFAMQDKT